jgi:nitrogen fixation protein NifB
LEKSRACAAEHKGCGTSGGSGKASCGSGAGANDLPPEIWEKVKNHPCYSEEAHHHYARMHVAVAPACNIQCNYCNRKYDCANESRPGVVSEKLTPEQAAKKVLAVASTIPQMTVLGIAGPGDPLANPEKTFKTFELIAKTAPDIKLCLSTNGLRCPTTSTRSPEVQRRSRDHHHQHGRSGDRRQIYPWVFWKHKRYTGRRGRAASHRPAAAGPRNADRARHPVQGQLGDDPRRQRQAPRRGQPGGQIARRVPAQHHAADLRARARHGVRLTGQRGPTAQELKALQDSCEGEMNMMRHCRQCRADAVGCSARIAAPSSPPTRSWRWRSITTSTRARPTRPRSRTSAGQGRGQAGAELETLAGEHERHQAAGRGRHQGPGLINEHFGHAKEFQVYELSTAGAKFVGHRRVDLYCQGGYGEEDSLDTIIRAINDCHAVFVAKIGGCPKATCAGGHRSGRPVRRRVHREIGHQLVQAPISTRRSGEIEHRRAATPTSVRARFIAA